MSGFNQETDCLIETEDGATDHAYLQMGYGAAATSRPSTSSAVPNFNLTVDELLFRVKYAALDKHYNVEADVTVLLQNCTERDIEKLLQELNCLPLRMRQKLEICKLLHSEGFLKRRYEKGKANKIEKKRGLNDFTSAITLWEETIANLTAYFGSNVASYFRFVRSIVYMNLIVALLLAGLITAPKIIDGTFKSNVTFGGHFGDLSDSIMFYGIYTKDLDFTYNLPAAYFITWLSVNLVCFVYIIALMIVRYKKSKLLTEKGSEYRFAWRTFCTWDYSITSRQGVLDHRTSLRTDLKLTAVVAGLKFIVPPIFQQLVKLEGWRPRTETKFTLARTTIFYIASLLVFVLSLYKVTENKNCNTIQDTAYNMLTAVVAGLKFIVPPIFQQLVKLEGWRPRTETKFTLARTTIFYIASLLVFVLSLYKVTENKNCNTIQDTAYNMTVCCWENDVGEEVFKVILLDFGILIVVGVVIHMGRALMVKYCWKALGYSKFDVVSCVLDVIYGQSLVWLGLYFSPLLGAVGFIKLVLVFYVRLIIAKVAMVPPQQLFRASSTGNFYLAILLLNLFVSLFPMAYAVIEVTPSSGCGPFSGRDRSYRVISDLIGDLPDWLENVFVYIGTPAIMVPVLILLVLSTIFFHVKFSSYKSLSEELKKQLVFERRVEKRKIFATGRAMSGGGTLTRHSSNESLISNITQTGIRYQGPTDEIIVEEHDM